MRKLSVLVAGVSLAVLCAGAANATVVTFDDAAVSGIVDVPVTTFSDAGLTFTNTTPATALMYVWDSNSPNSNGSNNNIFGFSSSDMESITKTGGGTFNLDSIDFAISWYDPNTSEIITINGVPLTITPTLTTYTLDLYNVSEVDISGVPSGTGYWLADNLTYDAANAVPEPSTLALFGAGLLSLFGFGLMRHSRKPLT